MKLFSAVRYSTPTPHEAADRLTANETISL